MYSSTAKNDGNIALNETINQKMQKTILKQFIKVMLFLGAQQKRNKEELLRC